MLNSLIYIASGGYKRVYESLPYDRIYLVDTCRGNQNTEKVKRVTLDALESIEYFRTNGISPDCLVVLRESQGEGGFTPHYWCQFDRNYQKMLESFCLEFSGEMTIDFYYLNSWFNYRHILKAAKTISRTKK